MSEEQEERRVICPIEDTIRVLRDGQITNLSVYLTDDNRYLGVEQRTKQVIQAVCYEMLEELGLIKDVRETSKTSKAENRSKN